MGKEIFGRRPEVVAASVFENVVNPAANQLNRGIETFYQKSAKAFREEMRKNGIFPADPVQKKILEYMVRRYVDLHISGEENLIKTKELLENGATVVFTPNHLSHADGAAMNEIARIYGIDLVAVLGKRILDNAPVDFMGKAVNCVHVWPPTEIPKTDSDVSEMKAMIRKSARGATFAVTNSMALLMFPEGGRTRENGVLKDDVFGSVVGFFSLGRERENDKKREHYVVPVALDGTDSVLPVHANKPKRGKVNIAIGEPYLVDDLMIDFKGNSRNEQWKETLFIRAMGKIAELLPEERRGVYNGPVKVVHYIEDGMVRKKAVPLAV